MFFKKYKTVTTESGLMTDVLPLPVADDLDVLVDRLDEQGHLDIQNNILRNFFQLGSGLGA